MFLGLAVAAVVVLIFTRGGSDQPDPPPESLPAAEAAGTSSVPNSSGADGPGRPAAADTTAAAGEGAREQEETAETAVTSETVVVSAAPEPDEAEPEETATALSAEASRYLLGLSAFQAALDGLVSDIDAVNRSWDDEKGDAPDEPSYRARYRQAESALENILDRVRGFHADVRNHPVPAPVAGQGRALAELSAGLVDSAEGVLAGLRRPRPDDGSARRAALADFEAEAADFSRRAAALAVLIEQNASALGLTAGGAGAEAAPPDEAAAAYLKGLADFREELDGLAVDMDAVNRSWDDEKGDAPDEPSYRARYRQAESALENILDRVRGFHARVQAHPIPASARALGAGPEALTARLVDSAEGVLAGLRRPRPDDGSARRAALADFNEAARQFGGRVQERTAAIG